jgi:hypothetical protein
MAGTFRPQSGDTPVSIPDAYQELSRGAFAVWVRMALVPDEDLAKGRAALARTCGYSPAQMNRVLAELQRKKYVAVDNPGAVGAPARLRTPKRPLIVSCHNRFVRL